MYRKQKGSISSYFITLYVFLIFCIYPLYFEDGYYNMATAKCRFFLGLSVAAFIAILIAVVIEFIIQKKGNPIRIDWKRISVTEKLLYVYIIMVLLAFVLSDFKKNVLWGATDWYMGTIPLLFMTFFAVVLIHTWQQKKWLMTVFLTVSAIVFLLGICNRFSVYPVAIEPHNAAFISTLGNINWFCGYMSVVSPIGIGLFVFTKEEEYKYKWQKGLLFLYVIIIFTAGFCQGSNSVFLWNGALFLTLFCLLLKSAEGIKKWLLLISMWGMSGQLVRILKAVFPEKYNYDSSVFVETNVTLILAIAAICLYGILHFRYQEKKEIPGSFRKGICKIILAFLVISILLWLVLAVYNTKVGIPFLKENPMFFFNENWGNGRGIIFKTAFEIFREMSPVQKLFGVGADGFGAFAYATPKIQAGLYNYFGDSILTNAHCEMLTNLINLGIVGTAVYISVFVTFVARCFKRGEVDAYACISALCVICYFANNVISFAQVLSIPYLFLIMGMGEAYLQRCENR